MMSSSKFRPPAQTAAAEMLHVASSRSHAAHSIVGQNKRTFQTTTLILSHGKQDVLCLTV